MLFIHRNETDPFFNLAAEEYLLKNFREDIFTLWINDPCIVLGKHQNALAEINYWNIKEAGIPVIRRITGGGTVYHDQGNLNFSFITTGESDHLVDYKRNTLPVIRFLSTFGIEAELQGKSSLVIAGDKFSGNSAHVFKNRVIHHGTILYNSNLDRLRKALSPGRARYADKSVKSMPADVTNIFDHMTEKIQIREFAESFLRFVMNNRPGSCIYDWRDQDLRDIRKLAEEKYRTWEWNFGYSPDYILESAYEDNGINWAAGLSVIKGIIQDIRVEGDKVGRVTEAEKTLAGIPHREDNIRKSLGNVNFADPPIRFDTELFIRHIF